MTELTMDELIAQREAAELGLAAFENNILPAALEALQSQPTQDLIVQIKALHDAAPLGMTKTQLDNVYTVLTKVPQYLIQRAGVVQAMLAPPVVEEQVIEGEFTEVVPEPTPEPIPEVIPEENGPSEPTPPE
jgi:hypothetical protein